LKALLAVFAAALMLAAPAAYAYSQYTVSAVVGYASTLTGSFVVQDSVPSSLTGSASFYYDGGTGAFEAKASLRGYAEELSKVSASASVEGEFSAANGSYTHSYSFSVEAIVEGLPLGGGDDYYPPFPGENPTVTLNVSVSGSVYEEGSVAGEPGNLTLDTYTSATVDVFVKDGVLLLFGTPGDIAARVKGESNVSTVYAQGPNYYEASVYVLVNFNSGNATVDEMLASMLYMALQSQYPPEATYFNVVRVNATAVSVEARLSGYGYPGDYCGCSWSHDWGYYGFPAYFDVRGVSVEASYSVKAAIDYGSFSVEASAKGSLALEDPAALPLTPGKVNVTVDIADGDVRGQFEADASGDPEAAFAAVKLVLLAVYEASSPGDSVYAELTAEDGYTFVLLHKGREELGSHVVFTEQNISMVKHLYIEPPGTDYELVDDYTLKVRAEDGYEAKMGVLAFTKADTIIVEAKKVVVDVGRLTIMSTKEIRVQAQNTWAQVELQPGTKINGTLLVEALSLQEAEQLALAYGFAAAGAGVEVSGIAEGAAKITVPADVDAAAQGNLVILEISANGSVKVIADYDYDPAEGVVCFTATSFSTFIPVYADSAQTATPTTTETEDYTETTTSTETTTTETTTTETTTTTTTTEDYEDYTTTTGEAGDTGAPEDTAMVDARTAAAIAILVIVAAIAFILVRK